MLLLVAPLALKSLGQSICQCVGRQYLDTSSLVGGSLGVSLGVGSSVGPSVSGSIFLSHCVGGSGSVVLYGRSVGQSDIQSIGTRVSQSASQSHVMMLLCMSIVVL